MVSMPASRKNRAAATAPASSNGRISLAVDGEPAADGPDPVGGHDPVGLHPEVGVAVAVGHRLAGDLEQELVALGGDEPEVLDLALEQLVGRDGGAVADRAHRVAGRDRARRAPCARRS